MNHLIFGGNGFIGNLVKSVTNNSNGYVLSINSKNHFIYESGKTNQVTLAEAHETFANSDNWNVTFASSFRYNPSLYRSNPTLVYSANSKAFLDFITFLGSKSFNSLCFLSKLSAVYGDNFEKHIKETNIINLKDLSNSEFYYGSSKYVQEIIVSEICRRRNIPFSILRLPSIYGPGGTRKLENAHVIPSIILKLKMIAII